jgi:hypothetical protein
MERLTEVERLLYICLAMYRKNHTELYINHHAGMEALLAQWFFPHVTIREVTDVLCRYPRYSYPDSCICGNSISPIGSTLRYECIVCKGEGNSAFLTDYDFGMVAGIISAHYSCYLGISKAMIKSLISWVIFNTAKQQQLNEVL